MYALVLIALTSVMFIKPVQLLTAIKSKLLQKEIYSVYFFYFQT